MKNAIAVILLSMLPVLQVQAQHKFGIEAGSLQIQEEQNSGMVFGGPQLMFVYGHEYADESGVSRYEARIGGGLLENREILGYSLHIVPADYLRAWRVYESSSLRLHAGLRGTLAYRLQLYPDLQTGHDFWLTNLSLAPAAVLDVGSRFQLRMSVAVLSAVSRTPSVRDPYKFSLAVWDLAADLNSHFNLRGPRDFTQLSLSATQQMTTSRRWLLSYTLEYSTFAPTPQFDVLSHTISIDYVFGE